MEKPLVKRGPGLRLQIILFLLDPTYLRHVSGWIEHRNFTDLTLKALADHEVVGKVKEELAKIKVTGTQPDLTGVWPGDKK